MSLAEAPSPKVVININKYIEESRFNSFHLLLFFLGLITVACDGYTLFVYGAAVPLLMTDFRISAAQAGVLGSTALIGAFVGSLVFGPFADKFGLKTTLVICAILFDAGIGFTGITHGPGSFAFWRFVSGIGVGGSMPNMVALATEYLPRRNRHLAISGLLSGISVGGLAAAVLGMWTFPHFGWRAVFWLPAIPFFLIPLYAKYLPESPTHLVKNNLLEEMRRMLQKVRPGESVPLNATLQVEAGTGKVPVAAIMQGGRAYSSVVFWVIFFMNLYVIYGFTIWLPKLMMTQGYGLATGLSYLLTLSIGSIAGSFFSGFIADRIGSKPTLALLYLVSCCSIVLVACTGNFWLLMALVTIAGGGFNGAQNTVNAYIAPYYPPSMRSTGLGICYALGRLGSIFGPPLIGLVMSMHFSYRATVIAIAVPAVIPAIGIFTVPEKYNYARHIAKG